MSSTLDQANQSLGDTIASLQEWIDVLATTSELLMEEYDAATLLELGKETINTFGIVEELAREGKRKTTHLVGQRFLREELASLEKRASHE